MTCKTREAAWRGERSKPHYYLVDPRSRVFWAIRDIRDIRAIEAFEARIDWSTWGHSR